MSPTNNGRIFSKGSSGCVTGYMMRMGGPDGNNLHLENAFNGQCHIYFYSNQTIVDDNWHFVVGVVDRAVGAKIYIDGKLDSSQALDTSAYDLSNSRNPTMGVNDVDASEHFNGDIDEVRVYNRALPASEIQQLYQGQGTCSNNMITFTAGTPAKAADVNANFDAHNCQIQALKAIVCQDHPTASICQ